VVGWCATGGKGAKGKGNWLFLKIRSLQSSDSVINQLRATLSVGEVKVNVPLTEPMAQRRGRGKAVLLDHGTRRGGWSAPRPGRFTPGKDPVPIVQEVGWAPGPVRTCAKNLAPTGIRSPDRPSRSQSQYRLSYPGSPVGEVSEIILAELQDFLSNTASS
jgi:hypothetical protein